MPPATERSELYKALMAVIEAQQAAIDFKQAKLEVEETNLDNVRQFIEANVP